MWKLDFLPCHWYQHIPYNLPISCLMKFHISTLLWAKKKSERVRPTNNCLLTFHLVLATNGYSIKHPWHIDSFFLILKISSTKLNNWWILLWLFINKFVYLENIMLLLIQPHEILKVMERLKWILKKKATSNLKIDSSATFFKHFDFVVPLRWFQTIPVYF